MEYTAKIIADTTEVVDGNQYIECRFENCKVIFRGGEIPHITGCRFDNCTWLFEGAAERTLMFMRQLYHGMGTGGAQLIEATIGMLRERPTDDPAPPSNPPSGSAPPPPVL